MLRAFLASLSAATLLAGGPAPAADETYTLKLYQGKKGDKTEHEKTAEGKGAFFIKGTKDDQEVAGEEKEVYTEEILEKNPGERKPAKLTRTYSVSESTNRVKTAKTPYAGETVFIEKKGNKYVFGLKDKVLKAAEVPDLDGEFNIADAPSNEDLLPKVAVKVGERWKVPAEIRAKVYATYGGGLLLDVAPLPWDKKEVKDPSKIAAEKSSVVGKLAKVYKKDGAQFGVVEITTTMNVTHLMFGLAKAKEGSKIVLKHRLDTCLDGTSPVEDSVLEMEWDIEAEMPGGQAIVLSQRSRHTEKTRVVPK